MRHGVRRIVIVGVAALFALVAAGCSGGNPTPPQAQGSSQVSGNGTPSPSASSPAPSASPSAASKKNKRKAETSKAKQTKKSAPGSTHHHSTRPLSPSRTPSPGPTQPPVHRSSDLTAPVSVSTSRQWGNGGSGLAYISAGGRYVAFESVASDLVSGDTNSVSDIFERDLSTHRTIRVSVANDGSQANGESHSARGISPDGRYVTFESFATNLVHGDTNGTWDAFLRDVGAGNTYRMSVNSAGAQGNGPSSDPVVTANGRYVAFESEASNLVPNDTNGAVSDVILRDRATKKTTLVSATPSGGSGNGPSSDPRITPDGHYLCFESSATNILPGDTNGHVDVFERNLWTHKTYRASLGNGGQQGNGPAQTCRISADGRYVAFESDASNLVPGDTNKQYDVFVRDMVAHHTYRVSVSSSGKQGNGPSADPTISATGRYACFESAASDLVRGDTNHVYDAFCRDMVAHTTYRVSVSSTGRQGNVASSDPSISADGRFVVFQSGASDLAASDTNSKKDVYVRGPTH